MAELNKTTMPGDRGAVDRITDRLRRSSILKQAVFFGRRVRTRAIESYLNIDTTNPPGKRFSLDTLNADPVPYEAVDYMLLRRYMKPVRLGGDDVVFDIGCGMGRMLCLFARRSVRKCIGIEFDRELAQIAVSNSRSLRGRRAPIEVRCGDAIEADYSEGPVYWMFNPFGVATMRQVLSRIRESLARAPRCVQLAYINPLHEHLVEELGVFTCVARAHSMFFKTYGASYWIHDPRSNAVSQANTGKSPASAGNH